MTSIHNGPDDFVDDALDGLTRAHPRQVRRVDGGVVRATPVPPGQVAVVLGGGSGHYPAFAGLVGPGLATGAVCGQVFTSPSAAQAYHVAHACDRGAGVLFLYGNYAGDVLHFGLAQERLRGEGHDVRTLLVTDDIASAPTGQEHQRRGVAGDFVVVKLAGAAAEGGAGLDEVERVARCANERTRTLGIALSGCTLPGADAPLFTVPTATMSVGLGIHGEPGVSDEPLPAARTLAERLITDLVAESRPEWGSRAVVLVNGLGTVSHEELFILFAGVARALSDRGVEVVDAEVGELVTSLDMGGLSVTVCWVDDELERLWRAPANSAAYTRVPGPEPVDTEVPDVGTYDRGIPAVADDRSAAARAAGPRAVAALDTAIQALAREERSLGDLDAVAGDGDHGTGMLRGARGALAAAQGAVDSGAGLSGALIAAGRAWADVGGGTSGALWGAGLERAARHLHDADDLDTAAIAGAARSALDAITGLGGANPGDKTIVDAFEPLVRALEAAATAGTGLGAAWHLAASAALAGAKGTAALVPVRGRARPLAERSRGHADPGATSFALLAGALAEQSPTAEPSGAQP
ncbi:dihydroxyacetone kinase family protein [Actinoplanes sp. NPDC051470]|uniref:dihydroxyacetone kinase family protein n=1 Tax=Actinoplanes sp. NPDC051470 TaxID=3157224 RepID=UPI003441CEDC